ncbi:hypothetical protein DITRI_Ditri15bG0033900 [Diplodiscus trichospermus]
MKKENLTAHCVLCSSEYVIVRKWVTGCNYYHMLSSILMGIGDSAHWFNALPFSQQCRLILLQEEKDKKIQDLYNELQHEKQQSAVFRQQLLMILKDLEEHAEFMSIRVEDIVESMKRVELDNV